MAFLPFTLFFFSYGIWFIIGLLKRDKSERKNMNNKATSTLVILLFLVHPNILQYMFSVLK